MKTRTILGAMLLLLVAGTMLVSAYHITAPVANTWVFLGVPFFIVCESDGPLDPRNPFPSPHGGVGGLCTSGLNAATCGSSCVPGSPPAYGTFTGFDLADSTGATSTIGYDVEIGVTFCNVAPAQSVVYREIYAWLSVDGADPIINGFRGHVAVFFDPTTSTDTSGTVSVTTTPPAGTVNCGADPAAPLAHTPVHLA